MVNDAIEIYPLSVRHSPGVTLFLYKNIDRSNSWFSVKLIIITQKGQALRWQISSGHHGREESVVAQREWALS